MKERKYCVGYSQKGCAMLDMMKAVCKEDEAIVRRLVADGADLHRKDRGGNTPLHEACVRNQLAIVSFLIEKGAKVNEKNKNGWTPLHVACSNVRTDTVQTLVQWGADVHAKTNFDSTPIHFIIAPMILVGWMDQLACAKILLAVGANVSVMNKNQKTAVQMLMEREKGPILRYWQEILNDLPETQLKKEDKKQLSALVFKDCLC